MKKLFIHQPFFRILSPIFSGVIIYLLVLLLNNNVAQLEEQFLGEELYFCIALSYIVQELSRFLLVLFKRIPKRQNSFLSLFIQAISSLVISIVIVTLVVILYFKYFVGFSATTEEIITLDSIFAVITLIYILLFISHQYLYKVNSEKLYQEELIKKNIEADFRQFKRGINPYMLFESLEALIVLMHQDEDIADEFIDHLSVIYRYILSSKDRQLVSFNEEYQHMKELENLLNKLPYRTIKINSNVSDDFLTVPGALLFFIEFIIRNTIISSNINLIITIEEERHSISISYTMQDKINTKFESSHLEEVKRVYSIYSEDELLIKTEDQTRTILIPKLTIKT